jgi:hypothetical protein
VAASTSRTIGWRLVRLGRQVGPVLISVGLVVWLVWQVTPEKLAEAAASPALLWLVLLTLVQMVALFLWDTVTLWWLFSRPQERLSFPTFLRVRTDTLLWSAINLEVGQAMFAWSLAEAQGTPVTAAFARCAVLALFDFGTLMSLGVVGSLVYHDSLLDVLRWIPIAGLAGVVLLAAALRFLPRGWRERIESKTWGSWLAWWTWRDSILLYGQRLILFLLVLVYAGIGLAICGLPCDVRTVVGIIPFVIIAESLPGTGGLGERETALLYLLRPPTSDQRALLLTFGLTWSLVVIFGRIAIGLVSRYLPRTASVRAVAESTPSSADNDRAPVMKRS